MAGASYCLYSADMAKAELPTARLRRIRGKRDALLDELEKVTEDLRSAVLTGAATGMSEAALARESGATRMTVRKWLGKQ